MDARPDLRQELQAIDESVGPGHVRKLAAKLESGVAAVYFKEEAEVAMQSATLSAISS